MKRRTFSDLKCRTALRFFVIGTLWSSTLVSCQVTNEKPFGNEVEAHAANQVEHQPLLDSGSWSFAIGSRMTIDPSVFPAADSGFFPDGHISVMDIDGDYYGFWGRHRSFRSISDTPLLQNHAGSFNPPNHVLGGGAPNEGPSNGFNDGGMWLIGIRELTDGRLAGFFHAESHWYPRSEMGWQAYKSIGVTYSSNNGLSWGTPQLLLSHNQPKGTEPKWSGLGDGCVIYNHLNDKYYCFYTPATGVTAICMASSSDPNGNVGSWQKWYNGAFSEPGIGGLQTAISPLSANPGANPSVHWNDYLEKFVMVWHGWDGKLYIAASDDCEIWEQPRLLLEDGVKAWYPNTVGYTSTTGGQSVTLYYGYDFQEDGRRTMAYRTLSFQKD
ncbi:hypothetical protein [Parapedobacter tibetensis]|uniref:hypothetical protein n=1 Tax=Parapedobacter tibetensis TaxID=2972951 RepID=UPI00214D5C6D|nr:hypothetical protein [Parapedobacter tibetensis]